MGKTCQEGTVNFKAFFPGEKPGGKRENQGADSHAWEVKKKDWIQELGGDQGKSPREKGKLSPQN